MCSVRDISVSLLRGVLTHSTVLTYCTRYMHMHMHMLTCACACTAPQAEEHGGGERRPRGVERGEWAEVACGDEAALAVAWAWA